MKIAVIGITENGVSTGVKIADFWAQQGHEVQIFSNHRGRNFPQCTLWSGTLGQLMAKLFAEYDALCCVMALGIVVRLVGPLAKHKSIDPAVLVIDENGQFVISVLSGHLGGANFLSKELAQGIGAVPVITTASDVQGKLAIDELARQLGWQLEPLANLVHVNSALVHNQPINFLLEQEFPLDLGDSYQVATYRDDCWPDYPQGAVAVTNRLMQIPAGPYLLLRPKNLHLGIGCRRGSSQEKILAAVESACETVQVSMKSLQSIASITAKADEVGLLAAAEKLNLPISFFEPEEINDYYQQYTQTHPTDQQLAWSEYVYNKMGVGGVCEPVALMSGRKTKLIQPKMALAGVTVAIAQDC